jgi:hypothetical protein
LGSPSARRVRSGRRAPIHSTAPGAEREHWTSMGRDCRRESQTSYLWSHRYRGPTNVNVDGPCRSAAQVLAGDTREPRWPTSWAHARS